MDNSNNMNNNIENIMLNYIQNFMQNMKSFIQFINISNQKNMQNIRNSINNNQHQKIMNHQKHIDKNKTVNNQNMEDNIYQNNQVDNSFKNNYTDEELDKIFNQCKCFTECKSFISMIFSIKDTQFNEWNKLYAINRKWLNEWKNHIGFAEISLNMKKSGKTFLEEEDKDWVKITIKQYSKNSYLEPLQNDLIYFIKYDQKKNSGYYKIDPLSNFVLLNKETLALFLNKNNELEADINNHPSVKVKGINNQLFIKIDELNYLVIFSVKEHSHNFEILITISSLNDKTFLEKLIDDLQILGVENWIKSCVCNIYTPEFTYQIENQCVTVKNKTILIKSKKNNNSLKPNNYDKGQLSNNLLENLKKYIKNDKEINQILNQITNDYNGDNLQNSTEAKYKSTVQKISIINLNIMNQNNFLNCVNNLIYPHLLGLENIGQTCYMNSVLECLSNIKVLTKSILNMACGKLDIKKHKLTTIYFDVLYKLFFPSDSTKIKKCIAPHNFKAIIGKMNPLFKGINAGDAKDFLFFLLQTLHDELVIKNNNFNMQNNMNLDGSNEMQMFQKFLSDLNNNKSIISDNFYGINKSILICYQCNKVKYVFQSFNFLIIPLKKAYEFKMKINSFPNYNLNLYEGIMSLSEPEIFTGENMIYCNYCQKLTQGKHYQIVYKTPNILIFILFRGKANCDFKGNFDFPGILYLSGNMNLLEDQNSPSNYFLMGVVTHFGPSSSAGHFIAYCRKDQNSKFICYNDSIVFTVDNENDVFGMNNSNNEYETKIPYILFYQKMSM